MKYLFGLSILVSMKGRVYGKKRDREFQSLGLWKEWRRARDMEGTYTLPIFTERRSVNAEGVPRLNYTPSTHILNVWYPNQAEDEIDVHRTRLQVGYRLKEVLHPKKYFTFVQRDSKIKRKKDVGYTIDYYAEVDQVPTKETVETICEICRNPILQ